MALLHANATFGNPPFEQARLRALIVRLSPFRDVERSTPHLVLFQALRRAVSEAYIDMAFLPPRAERERRLREGRPLLSGEESGRPARDFDLVLVSNAYTLELINLPYLFAHSGIPLLASARGEGWPPFVLGGSNALAAQAIVTEGGDSLADALFFGEGEEEVVTLARALVAGLGLSKRERLAQAAAEMNGLWVTGGWPERPLRVAQLVRPGLEHLLVDYPLLDGHEAATARLQIAFGCPAFCTFCFEGYERKPYREVALVELLEAARRLKRASGARTLELYAYNFNTHRDILALLFELNRLFDTVGAMSQRVDLLDGTPGLLEAEVAAGKRHFTLGIEGISARLRAWLHKSLPDEAIQRTLARLLGAAIRQVKLFYLLTGYERPDDWEEFRAFVRALKALRRQHNPGIRVTFSFGLLMRMPFTPLRYDRLFLEPEAWKPLIGAAKSACETNGFEFRLATGWDEYCVSQVLALADYGLWRALVELAEGGACFDERLPPGYWGALQSWMQAHGFWTPALLDEKGPDARFPFAFVETGVRPEFLYRQYARAQAGEPDEGYCLGGPAGGGRCLGCGACADDEQRAAMTQHTIRPAGEAHALPRLERMMREKWRLKPVYVWVRLPRATAGAGAEWLSAWALRGLLAAYPELTDELLAAQESLFTAGENRGRFAGLWGETVLGLKAWDPAHLLEVLLGPPRANPACELLGPAEGFTPGLFERATLSFDLPAGAADVPRMLVEHLRAAHVACNLRREGECLRLDLAPRALGRKVVFAGWLAAQGQGVHVQLEVGPRFDLRACLRALAGDGAHRVDVEVGALRWAAR